MVVVLIYKVISWMSCVGLSVLRFVWLVVLSVVRFVKRVV